MGDVDQTIVTVSQSPLPRVGHVMGVYLPRSETFVFNLLRHQQRSHPVVIAGAVFGPARLAGRPLRTWMAELLAFVARPRRRVYRGDS